MYDEQSESFCTYDGSDPVQREVYQIFLNIWENSKAFIDYWATYPLSGPPQGEIKVQSEVPREVQGTRDCKARPSEYVHKRLLRGTCY